MTQLLEKSNENKFLLIPQAVDLEILGIPRLMAIPSNIYIDKVVPNNVWMKDDVKGNKAELLHQWSNIYRELSMDGPVFVMPDSPKNSQNPNQDLVWAANSGIALKGKDGKTKFVVSRFCSEPRRGETEVIQKFVANIFGEENVILPPKEFNGEELFFEGEADMKAIHFDETQKRADVYIMGVGVRTNETAAKWFESQFDIRVIPYKAPDSIASELYHLDCLVFPIDKFSTIINVDGIDEDTLSEISEYTELIEISDDEVDMMFNGITNSIRLRNRVFMPYDPDYSSNMTDEELEEFSIVEEEKLEYMNDICNECGLQLVTTEVSGGYFLGAQLSCFSCALVDQYYLYYKNGI